MFQNNNQKVIKKLAKRSLKSSKNTIAIFSIILATVMFTALFTITGSLFASAQNSSFRKVGSMAHAAIKHVTINEFKDVSKDPKVKDSSYSIIIGEMEGKKFEKLATEVRYGEDNYAKWNFSLPTSGKMPQSEKELATSTLVLDALGLPHQLGQEIEITFKTDSKKITNKFTLCGIWHGDPIAYRQTLWLSKNYSNKVAPLLTSEVKDRKSTGLLTATIMFSSSWNLEQQAAELSAKHEGISIKENSAYETADVGLKEVVILLLAIMLIFLSGYLLIYNIFYIFVAQDIRSYGLLKTIGTTSKQIRCIIYRKAMVLSIMGIPIGLFIGWLIGRLLVPYIIHILTDDISLVTTINPLIFVVSTIFSLLTVYVSSLRPAQLASKITPVEAVEYTGIESSFKKETKAKKSHKVTPLTMAISNLRKNRKKVFVVSLSFALSLVILNSTFGLIKSFDFEKYVEDNTISDFTIADSSIINKTDPFNFSGVSEETIAQIKKLNGIEQISSIFMSTSLQNISEKHMDSLIKQLNSSNENKLKTHILTTIYGFNELVASKFELIEGSLDNESFKNGDGIYITPCRRLENKNVSLYKPGEQVFIKFGNGNSKKYNVLGIINYPGALMAPVSNSLGMDYILSSNEYKMQMGKTQPMEVIFDVKDSNIDTTEKWLERYCKLQDTSLDYKSRNTLKSEFRGLILMFQAVGGALCMILAIIGILNFINSMMTSILVRKRELAMLQAVGMTKRQVYKMLIYEGMVYAVIGLLASFVLASIANVTLVRSFGNEMNFFTWKFTLVPVVLSSLPLLIITFLIPIYCYKKLTKNTIVDRLGGIE